MRDEYYKLESYPGDGKHYKNRLLLLFFRKSDIGDGKRYPSSYSIVWNVDGEEIERYYLRKNPTEKFVEVPRSAVFPN